MATATNPAPKPKRNEVSVAHTATFPTAAEALAALKQIPEPTNQPIKFEPNTCRMSVGGKEFYRGYYSPLISTTDEVLNLLEKDPIGAVADLEYGMRLTYASDVRAGIDAEVSGPEKAIQKNIEAFMKARLAVGKPVTLEDATKKVKADLGIE